MRSARRSAALAQRAAGEQPAVAPRGAGARHHDLDVLAQGPVLEGVVQHDGGDAEPLDRVARGLVPIAAHDDRDPWKAPRQQERLVPAFLRVEPDRCGVGHDLHAVAPASIAPAHQRRQAPELDERAHGQLGRGRLAGAADREIADGDDGAAKPARSEQPQRVQPVARPEQAAVAAGGDVEHARHRGAEAALPARAEPLVNAPHARCPG
jgi:hypothetical protein